MRYGQAVGKIKINMISELPAIQPIALGRFPCSTSLEDDSEEIDEARFYPSPGLLSDEFRYVPIEDAEAAAVYHYPALVHKTDGSPWMLGNLYLTDLAFDFPPVVRSTLKKVALSLVDFINVMVDLEIDIFSFPLRKSARPTYAYSSYLSERVTLNPNALEASNQHVSRIEDFYRFLELKQVLKPENSMWKEVKKTFRYVDQHGFGRLKDVIVTDLRLKSRSRLKKGGAKRKLRAYDEDEQVAIIDSLLEIGNTEMTLAFLMALMAGPRMQSVFTMPRSVLSGSPGADYLSLPIGLGALIDSKYDVQNNLFIPLFLVGMAKVYLRSDRYKARDEKSYLAGQKDNYIFLTKSGRPYYSQKNDPNRGKYKNPQEGGAIYAFIRNQLEPSLKRKGLQIVVNFHNLRATFANNLVKGLLDLYEKNKITMTQVVLTVNERLGHRSIETTEKYIEDIKREKVQALSQSKWEEFLEVRIKRAFGEVKANDTLNDETDSPV
ncbi:hypothetical protein PZ739_10800 [Pseudomonas kermanshahensis]|uniref:hypothetical protein n=1 Tax=Pseudomonas kermanshahensis TaxID=2745482 RepID=UPI0023DC3125|nr:hypothetical protein [Pseudomonas kermanshahensis]WEL57610.1 hypothetical protein PZ739_10800 [Pseudomonas kermanshahensis]